MTPSPELAVLPTLTLNEASELMKLIWSPEPLFSFTATIFCNVESLLCCSCVLM